ncbi:MAG TPA: hypothetical protein VHS99_09890 [Chloroflexota bacterium]|nr:hypothetical protein [Chloroflexota bacterium]
MPLPHLLPKKPHAPSPWSSPSPGGGGPRRGRRGRGARGGTATPPVRSPQSAVLTHALAPLGGRVRRRALLEHLHAGLLWGGIGATTITLAGRLLGRPDAPLAAIVVCAIATGMVLTLALLNRPQVWDVARAADDLGLQEQATSALFASGTNHPVAPLLTAGAVQAIGSLDPQTYPLVTHPRRWWAVAGAFLALLLALLVPIPALGDAGRRAQEARAVAATRAAVQALQAPAATPRPPEPLAQATAQELAALEQQLASARSAAEAARALEQAQQRLAALPAAQDFTRQRALDELGAAWAGQPDLEAVRQAIQARDADATRQAMADLAGRADAMSPEQRQQLQLALQAGANATRDVPELSSALRQAASRVAAGQPADGSQAGSGEAIRALEASLSQSASQGAGLRTVQQAVSGLGQTRAALGQASASGGAASGAPAGSASSAQAGAAGSGPGAGSAGGASAGSSNGAGSGSGTGSGSGQGGSSGAGGTGQGTGSGAGTGGAGQGTGSGAGAGGAPGTGQPGAGGASAGPGQGAVPNRPPNAAGATTYDPIYAPHLQGGEGGPSIQLPADSSAASGETVDLPDSSVTLGAQRPYNEVYGQYENAARQSLTRQSLPPALQSMVQRYFSAIAPESQPQP